MIERDYETRYVYRVWYTEKGTTGNTNKEAYFTDKNDAANFATEVNGIMNRWQWQVLIEK